MSEKPPYRKAPEAALLARRKRFWLVYPAWLLVTFLAVATLSGSAEGGFAAALCSVIAATMGCIYGQAGASLPTAGNAGSVSVGDDHG